MGAVVLIRGIYNGLLLVLPFWLALLVLVLLCSCSAPIGTKVYQPVCLVRCHSAMSDITGNPHLTTLTTTGGALTGGDTTRSATTTTTTSGG